MWVLLAGVIYSRQRGHIVRTRLLMGKRGEEDMYGSDGAHSRLPNYGDGAMRAGDNYSTFDT